MSWGKSSGIVSKTSGSPMPSFILNLFLRNIWAPIFFCLQLLQFTAVRAPQEEEAQIIQAGGARNWPHHTETSHATSEAEAFDL